MVPIYGHKLADISDRLVPLLESLIDIKRTLEVTKNPALVSDYFGILVAFDRINEAKERLLKIAEEREGKEE